MTLSLVAFLISAGKFIEDYHFSNPIKAQVQSFITKSFIWLYDVKIPDIPLIACRKLFQTDRKITPKVIWLVMRVYFAAVSSFYFLVSIIFHAHGLLPIYFILIPFGLGAFGSVIFVLFCLPVGRYFTRKIVDYPPLTQRIATPVFLFLLPALVTVAIIFVGNSIEALLTGVSNYPHFSKMPGSILSRITIVYVLYFFIGIFLEPTTLILFGTAICGISLTFCYLIQIVLLVIFDKSSDPRGNVILDIPKSQG